MLQGTHVAGIVSANNNGVGVVGVSPGTPIYSIKVRCLATSIQSWDALQLTQGSLGTEVKSETAANDHTMHRSRQPWH